MYWKYSLSFLIASLVQAGIIIGAEMLRLTSLGAKLTIMQLIIHVLAGQLAGFLLFYLMQRLNAIGKADLWIVGIVYGTILWVILLTLNSWRGAVKAPWSLGLPSILISLAAFITYGVIATYTIKKYGYEKVGDG